MIPELETLQLERLDPTTHAVLRLVVTGIHEAFGERLLGIYAYGSAVIGDFDPGISDLDFTAVLSADAEDEDLDRLEVFHNQIVNQLPEWRDRIEVQYISRDALQTFRERRNRMINISPGEPIHVIDTGIEWLANWYFVVDHGLVLYGLPTSQAFPAISGDEFVSFARDHARDWLARLDALDGSQAQSYAILTNCRALYTHRTGQQVSKRVAANWVATGFPEWADAIDDARMWRRQPQFSSASTAHRARTIVQDIVGIIDRESSP